MTDAMILTACGGAFIACVLLVCGRAKSREAALRAELLSEFDERLATERNRLRNECYDVIEKERKRLDLIIEFAARDGENIPVCQAALAYEMANAMLAAREEGTS